MHNSSRTVPLDPESLSLGCDYLKRCGGSDVSSNPLWQQHAGRVLAVTRFVLCSSPGIPSRVSAGAAMAITRCRLWSRRGVGVLCHEVLLDFLDNAGSTLICPKRAKTY